jgi:hypothetical protein
MNDLGSRMMSTLINRRKLGVDTKRIGINVSLKGRDVMWMSKVV